MSKRRVPSGRNSTSSSSSEFLELLKLLGLNFSRQTPTLLSPGLTPAALLTLPLMDDACLPFPPSAHVLVLPAHASPSSCRPQLPLQRLCQDKITFGDTLLLRHRRCHHHHRFHYDFRLELDAEMREGGCGVGLWRVVELWVW